MPRMTTGQLAQRGGVNVESIRFYEREGLLPSPPRTAGGYRMFAEDDVRRIHFIKRAQDLGFTLKEIKDLLELRFDPDIRCDHVQQRARAKLADIESKIRDLQRMEKALARLAAACPGSGDSDRCPIWKALDSETEPVQTERR